MLKILVFVMFSTALTENTLRVSNQTFVSSTSSMGGYLEVRTTDPNNRQLTAWKPVCGGSQWTDKEALVACNQLRHHNTTTIAITSGQCSSFPYEINDAVEISMCIGVEATLENCGSTTFITCNNWGGIICSSLEMCSEDVCSNSSRCQPSSTCYNCTTPPELNCMCYSECSPPCLNGGRCGYNSTCQCPPGWTGLNCNQSPALTLPPHPSSTTEELIYPATLAPTPPPHPSSTTEELIYPATPAAPTLVPETCQPSCLNGGTCSIVNNIRSCQCPPSYIGPQCEHEEGGGEVSVHYIAIIAVLVLLILSLLLIVAVVVVVSRIIKRRKKKKLSCDSPDDADGYLTMRAIVSRNSHYAEEDTEPEEMSDSEHEMEHQSNGGPELDPNSSTRETVVSKNDQVSQYDKLLSKNITEDDYTAPGREKTKKEKSDPQMPCYDSVKNKEASCSREATKTEQPSQHYDKLLPKETTETSYTVQNQESEKLTLMSYYDCVRENYSSSIEVADKTEETYECDKLLSEEFTEYSYAIPYQNKTSKVVAFTPYHDGIKMPETNVTVSTCEYSEIPTEEKSRQAYAAESNAANQESDHTYYELEDIPKTLKLPLTKYTGNTGEYTEIPTTNNIATKRSTADKYSRTHQELEDKPPNLSSANSSNGECSITMLDNYEANSTKPEGSDHKPVMSIYDDRFEWDYETIKDPVVEKGALASSRGFCQLKQKCNSNFGKPLNEGLQNSAVFQDEIYDDVVYI